MLCEGGKMLYEAISSGAQVKTLLVRAGRENQLPSGLLERAEQMGAALYTAPDALFRLASEVETPQDVIFSCRQPVWTAEALDGKKQVLLLDGLQDPGNLGTILRTAEAFALGARCVVRGLRRPVFAQGRALDDGGGVPPAVRGAAAARSDGAPAAKRPAGVCDRAA